MRKEFGCIFVEQYDKYGNRVSVDKGKSYMDARGIARKWEEKHPKNTAVISRILYNTVSNNDKWDHAPT